PVRNTRRPGPAGSGRRHNIFKAASSSLRRGPSPGALQRGNRFTWRLVPKITRPHADMITKGVGEIGGGGIAHALGNLVYSQRGLHQQTLRPAHALFPQEL